MTEKEVAEARAKYATDLADYIKCPVCFFVPMGEVSLCKAGHILCKKCKGKLQAKKHTCPLCRMLFSDGRCYAVERLRDKAIEMIIANTPRNTQSAASVAAAKQPLLDVYRTKCLIGFCREICPTEDMHIHVLKCHPMKFKHVEEDKDIKGRYIKQLKVKYDLDKLYDFGLYNAELSLFFLSVFIDENGDMLIDISKVCHRPDLAIKCTFLVAAPETDIVEKYCYVPLCSMGYTKFNNFVKFDRKQFKYYFNNQNQVSQSRNKPLVVIVIIEVL